MHLLALLTAVTLTSAAAIPGTIMPRDRAGYCCFTLQDTSGKTLQEASNGQTYFSSSYPNGRYCLDRRSSSNHVLYNAVNGACITDSRGRMTCLDPIPGDVAWTLAKGNILTYGSSTTWSICDGSNGKDVFGGTKSGCKQTTLKAVGKTGTC
ncbi:hypothetical protein LIA77_09392 [Sarocladium implicatum]|nr:hypothetical protein LIA77_09392 [Sarocladium implicatum]